MWWPIRTSSPTSPGRRRERRARRSAGRLVRRAARHPHARQEVPAQGVPHHLLDRPRNRPVRTAIGAAWISLYLVLLAGGGNDIVATRLHLSINTVTWAVRTGMFLVPAVVFVVTRRICPGLQLRDRELVAHGRATGVIRRLPHGEYVEVHEPLDRARLHTLTAHDRPGELVAHGRRRRAVAGPVRSERGRTPGRSG